MDNSERDPVIEWLNKLEAALRRMLPNAEGEIVEPAIAAEYFYAGYSVADAAQEIIETLNEAQNYVD